MSRQRVSKGSVIIKKEEKVKVILDSIKDNVTEENFINKFKEIFPDAWNRIVKRYQEHERLTKPVKFHPMAEPNKYLKNLYRTSIRKRD